MRPTVSGRICNSPTKRFWRLGLWGLIASVILTGCASTAPSTDRGGSNFAPLSALVRFYQGPLNHLSAVRYSECPMYPSDSEYSVEALRKHGSFMGWMMSVDRLMRCGRDETKYAPRVMVDGKWKYYDPVEANDFWWDRERGVSAQDLIR